MNCEEVRGLFPDYLAGSLPDRVHAELTEHLEACVACREEQESLLGLWTKLSLLPEIEPSPAADSRFQTMLAAYRAGWDQPKHGSALRTRLRDWLGRRWLVQPAWQFAVVLLLFGGGLLAGWSLRRSGSGKDSSTGTQLAELRREILSLKEQTALALLQQPSASERLRGMDWTSRLDQPDEQVPRALLRALDSDPNVNVRLAAVEALQRFARQAPVRRALLNSLPRQPSPLVQVELIDLMVDLDDKETVPVLESLLNDRELNETVRERVRWGLAQLG